MIITAVYTAIQGTLSPSMPIIQYLGGGHIPLECPLIQMGQVGLSQLLFALLWGCSPAAYPFNQHTDLWGYWGCNEFKGLSSPLYVKYNLHHWDL